MVALRRFGVSVTGTAYAIPHLQVLPRAFVRTRRVFVSRSSRGHGMTGKALKSPVVDQIRHGARRGGGSFAWRGRIVAAATVASPACQF